MAAGCANLNAGLGARSAGSADAFHRALQQGPPPVLRRPPGPIPHKGHFSTVLQHAVKRIYEHGASALPDHVVHDGGEFVTLLDGFPKAEVHLLALPKESIPGPAALAGDARGHLPMLKRLAAYVAWLLGHLASIRPDLTWRHGVHASPSLQQLHVHIISQDFNSPCMKNKKHFNSFQPPFLVPVDELIAALEQDRPGAAPSPGARVALRLEGQGRAGAQAEAWLRGELRCSGCGAEFGSKFAELKRHLGSCSVPPSASPPCLWRDSSPASPAAQAPEEGGDGSVRASPAGIGLEAADEAAAAPARTPASKRPRGGLHGQRADPKCARSDVVEVPDSE